MSHQVPKMNNREYLDDNVKSTPNDSNKEMIEPLLFFTRLQHKHIKLTQNEYFFLKTFSQKQNSVDSEFKEAILALGVLHIFLNNQKKTHNFTEEDIFTAETVERSDHLKQIAATKSQSLEQIALDYKVDLVSALQYNHYLQSLNTYDQFFSTIQYEKESLLAQHLMVIIKKGTRQWLALAKRIQSISPEEVDLLSSLQDTKTSSSEKIILPPLPYEHGPFNDLQFEKKMTHINEFISKKNYTKAIELLKTIDQDHFQYSLVKEKIKEASNLAVQDLRKQAAEFFAKAIPITDLKVRATYLKKSQNLLLKVLTQYPEASNIATIRKNLTIINKNLDLLETQKKSNS